MSLKCKGEAEGKAIYLGGARFKTTLPVEVPPSKKLDPYLLQR